MSWMQDLFETYEKCQTIVGQIDEDENNVPLLPICHTTQKAQVEVVLNEEGKFRRASVVPKESSRTIIPCTESSSGRTSGEAPHPLCDKLQYIACNYSEVGGTKRSYTNSYIKLLEEWCSSPYSDPKIHAILKYVKGGTLIADLVAANVLIAGKDNKLLDKWEKAKDIPTPRIFEVASSQTDIFVRWAVEIPGSIQSAVWTDRDLWDKWIKFYLSTRTESDVSYVSGNRCYPAEQHPAKIRHDGDKAKLISGNDFSGFTFRGRFITPEQAATVGYEETHKAHSALRWLISRQGYQKDGLAIVVWATSGMDVPQIMDDAVDLLGLDTLPEGKVANVPTAEEIAHQVNKLIAGYSQKLDVNTSVIVMGLDAATPGRMSVTYYQKLNGSEFLNRLLDWQESCAWMHSYHFVTAHDESNGKVIRRPVQFIGAPAPIDIAVAAYGSRLDEKLRKATLKRILPCIIEGQPVPRDLVESACRRAENRNSMEAWEWNKTLSIACALFRKQNYKREKYSMSLDPDRKTRDYLYGRLLALAESLEQWALNKAGENRETSAARLMQRFADHPYSTWRNIELSLVPYKARLGGQSIKRQRMIDEVIASFNDDDFLSDKKLSGEFLLGYHCQREELRKASDSNHDTEVDEN